MSGLALIMSLAACGGDGAASQAPEPTAAQRPTAPDGWKTLTTAEGDVRLIVPPDIDLINAAPGSLAAQLPMRDGILPFEVVVEAPGAELGPPGAGESIFAYLQNRGWLPGADAGITFGPIVERETSLPAGRAFEVRVSVQPGTPEEGRVAIYLIGTQAGFALLRFVGTPAGMEARRVEIELMSRLVEFGVLPSSRQSDDSSGAGSSVPV
jgi:hypothetical protein